MASCWLINFKNSSKMILSEDIYNNHYQSAEVKENVISEEHWFDMDKCIEKNPDVDSILEI